MCQFHIEHIRNYTSPSYLIQVDIGGHPPFPTSSKQFSGNFGKILFLVVFTSGAVLRP